MGGYWTAQTEHKERYKTYGIGALPTAQTGDYVSVGAAGVCLQGTDRRFNSGVESQHCIGAAKYELGTSRRALFFKSDSTLVTIDKPK